MRRLTTFGIAVSLFVSVGLSASSALANESTLRVDGLGGPDAGLVLPDGRPVQFSDLGDLILLALGGDCVHYEDGSIACQ